MRTVAIAERGPQMTRAENQTSIASPKNGYSYLADADNVAKQGPIIPVKSLLNNNFLGPMGMGSAARLRVWGSQKWEGATTRPEKLHEEMFQILKSDQVPFIAANYERDGKNRSMAVVRYIRILAAAVSTQNTPENLMVALEKLTAFYSGLRREGTIRKIFLQISMKLVSLVEAGEVEKQRELIMNLLNELDDILDDTDAVLSERYYELNFSHLFPTYQLASTKIAQLDHFKEGLNQSALILLQAPLIGIKQMVGQTAPAQMDPSLLSTLDQLEILYSQRGLDPEVDRKAGVLEGSRGLIQRLKKAPLKKEVQKNNLSWRHRMKDWWSREGEPKWRRLSPLQKVGARVGLMAGFIGLGQGLSYGVNTLIQTLSEVSPFFKEMGLMKLDFFSQNGMIGLTIVVLGSAFIAGHKMISRATWGSFKWNKFSLEATTVVSFVVFNAAIMWSIQAMLASVFSPFLATLVMVLFMIWFSGWTSKLLGLWIRNKTEDQLEKAGVYNRAQVPMLGSAYGAPLFGVAKDDPVIYVAGKTYRNVHDLYMYTKMDYKEVFFHRWYETGRFLQKVQFEEARVHIQKLLEDPANQAAINQLKTSEFFTTPLNDAQLEDLLLSAHTALSLQFLLLKGRAPYMLGSMLEKLPVVGKSEFLKEFEFSEQLLSNSALMHHMIGILKKSDSEITETAYKKYLYYVKRALSEIRPINQKIRRQIEQGQESILSTRRPDLVGDMVRNFKLWFERSVEKTKRIVDRVDDFLNKKSNPKPVTRYVLRPALITWAFLGYFLFHQGFFKSSVSAVSRGGGFIRTIQ